MADAKHKPDDRVVTSPLMVGRGLVRTSPCTERIELVLDLNDLTHIVTHRSKQKLFNVEQTENHGLSGRLSSPAPTSEAYLPKTYMTRSGSLLLFSEKSIPKVVSPIKVRGQKISLNRIGDQENVHRWGKLVNKDRRVEKAKGTVCILYYFSYAILCKVPPMMFYLVNQF